MCEWVRLCGCHCFNMQPSRSHRGHGSRHSHSAVASGQCHIFLRGRLGVGRPRCLLAAACFCGVCPPDMDIRLYRKIVLATEVTGGAAVRLCSEIRNQPVNLRCTCSTIFSYQLIGIGGAAPTRLSSPFSAFALSSCELWFLGSAQRRVSRTHGPSPPPGLKYQVSTALYFTSD